MIVKVAILLLIIVSVEAQQDRSYTLKQFAADYYKERNVQNIVMLTCWSIKEQVDMTKFMSNNGIRIAIFNIYNDMEDKLNIYKTYTGLFGVMYDFCCYNKSTSLLKNFSYLNYAYKWLIYDCGLIDNTLKYIQTIPLNIVTDLSIASTQSSNDVDIYSVYHTGFDRDGTFNLTYIGRWSFKNNNLGWRMFFKLSHMKDRFHLNGMMMKVVTLISSAEGKLNPNAYLTDYKNAYTDTIFKLNYQFILLLQSIYNFKIKFIFANNFSDREANGSYKAENLLGILRDKKADIMAGGLILDNDRVEITDVIYSTYPFKSGFIFRYLGDFGNVKMSFYSPFENTIWYCYLSTIFLIIITTWCILSIENKFVSYVNKTIWNISDVILSVISACCQMGSEVMPITSSSRLVYFIFFFSCLIIYNFYTSSIVSSLLNFRSQTFDIVDLANSPLTCGSHDVGYVHNLLFDTPLYPNMAYFNSKKKTKNFYYSLEEGVDKIKRGGFAYHVEYSLAYHLIEKTFEASEICELQEIDVIAKGKLAILAMKQSQYSEMFKRGMNKIAETGQLHRLVLKWLARKPQCQSSKSFTVVGFNQIIASFKILFIGMALSVVLVCIEHIKNKQRDKLNRMRKKYFDILQFNVCHKLQNII